MDSNVQVNEDYKFKISYIFNFFRDISSTSEVVEDNELSNKIDQIKKEQDNTHIESLEKDIETHESYKNKKLNKKAVKKNNINNSIEENMQQESEIILDEEKDR